MGRVLTNTISLEVATEQTPGVLPGSPIWRTVEPNGIGKFGPSLKKMERMPISKNRQHRKGALVDLDSTVEFEADITYAHMLMFSEGLFFSVFKGPFSTPAVFEPTAVTATGYTVASGGALAAGALIVARGFANAANNGLKVVLTMSTATEIKAAGLVVETAAPAGATVEVAGVQGAVADFAINAALNLQATAFNWSTGTNIVAGQFIWIGDIAGATNSFANAADRGFARVVSVSATILVLAKKGQAFVADPGTGKSINVLFGRFVRNVAVDHADYLETTFQFELGYENLQNPGPGDEYEYATGNFANELTFDFPLANKGTIKASFVGLTTANPTVTRATNAGTPKVSVATGAVNTVSDFMRLRITNVDETGLTTDFKSLTMTVRNNVTPEKVLGTLGGKYVNAGMLDVEITANVVFTSSDVIKAIRDNRTVTMEVGFRNDDGGFVFDVPAMCIGEGDKDFPVNQSVSINLKSYAFQDPVLGSSVSLSTFPYLPAS